ncbi:MULTISPECIES: SlyX family protein [unclassified Treponema]|uniref:SlyX family protein n=1 Tax=unclassified Treponema TaxID=2638727 RepID=UPI0025E8D5FB|nr:MULTISPECIES: SlyX family protein [unclassified Treponema]MBQ8678410.1 SlyX family protein [Treponema sp.]
MEKEVEEKFLALETKIAYMDDFINKLQEEVVESQKEIQILREENRILSGRIQDLSENLEIPNRKPPHY